MKCADFQSILSAFAKVLRELGGASEASSIEAVLPLFDIAPNKTVADVTKKLTAAAGPPPLKWSDSKYG